MASDLSSGTRTGATRPVGNGARPAATGSETVGMEKRPPSGSAPSAGWGLPLVVLIAGMFMSVLDISIVNVAILTTVSYTHLTLPTTPYV